MRISKLWAIVAPATLLLAHLASPTPAHANTYNLSPLANDNRSFYGMDDAGHIVFSGAFFGQPGCPYSAYTCYQEIGVSGYTTTPPALTYDFASATCTEFALASGPCQVTDNNITATISKDPHGLNDLWEAYGSTPAELVITGGIDGIFAINGVGDIVFDNALLDEWYVSVDPPSPPATTAPEPSTLLLLGTGLLAPIYFVRRRRVATASL